MNLYKIVGKLNDQTNAAEGETATVTVWTGSQAESAKARSNLISSGQVRRHADITTESVDFATSKTELLAWLNTNAV